MEYLNADILHTWSDESLAQYHQNIKAQMARLAMFESQVQAEWDYRYPQE